jgi:hypothetical protein
VTSFGAAECDHANQLGAGLTSDNSPVVAGFDYGVLDTATATEASAAATRIRGYVRSAVLDTGKDLLVIKEKMERGQFIAWVETECQINIRTAQRAMRAAQLVEKNDKLSYLPPDGLLALADRTAPEPSVAEIVRQIEAGEKPTAVEIKRRIGEAKQDANWAATLAKMSPRRRRGGARREAETKSEGLEREHREAERSVATDAAVKILVERLGDQLDEFLKLVDTASWWNVNQALLARSRRPPRRRLGDAAP